MIKRVLHCLWLWNQFCLPQMQTAQTKISFWFLCVFQDNLPWPTAALLLSVTLALQGGCTHQPAPRESRSCCGQWPGSMAASRCSSMTPGCPRNGRSYSWLGPRTRSHLCEQRHELSVRHNPTSSSAKWEKISSGLTCYYCHHTLPLVGIWSPGTLTVAVEGALGVDAVAVGAQRLVVAFVHIWGRTRKSRICNEASAALSCVMFGVVSESLTNALQEVAVIVEALLTVALVARQRVLTAALLADFISEQRALVDVCRR